MKDIFGQALSDYYYNSFTPPLLLHNEYGIPEEIPIERYFAKEGEYSLLEIYALEQFSGKVLDIGSATGRHALHLQELGYDITALDISASCGKLMHEMGVKKVIVDDIFNFNDHVYDTISMLINGIGIAGNISGLKELLMRLKTMLQPAGQLLNDTSDISYLYENIELPRDKYYGELSFNYEYKGVKGETFNWLYIDQQKLIEIANKCDWSCQVIFEDETEAYLARLQYK